MKRIKTHVKKGDKVEITVGKFKGRTGKVLQVNTNKNTVLVEGGKMVKKTVKKSEQNPEGGIIDVEAPIHISNVKKIESKEKTTDKQ